MILSSPHRCHRNIPIIYSFVLDSVFLLLQRIQRILLFLVWFGYFKPVCDATLPFQSMMQACLTCDKKIRYAHLIFFFFRFRHFQLNDIECYKMLSGLEDDIHTCLMRWVCGLEWFVSLVLCYRQIYQKNFTKCVSRYFPCKNVRKTAILWQKHINEKQFSEYENEISLKSGGSFWCIPKSHIVSMAREKARATLICMFVC